MKKLNILLLAALTLGITTTSCSKSDSGPSIVAKWTFDTYTQTKAGTTSASTPVNDPTCTDKNYLDLRTGGIFEQQTVGSDSSNPCGTAKVDGNYTYQNNILHTTASSQTQDYTVVSVTSTNLVIKIPIGTDPTEYYTVTCIK